MVIDNLNNIQIQDIQKQKQNAKRKKRVDWAHPDWEAQEKEELEHLWDDFPIKFDDSTVAEERSEPRSELTGSDTELTGTFSTEHKGFDAQQQPNNTFGFASSSPKTLFADDVLNQINEYDKQQKEKQSKPKLKWWQPGWEEQEKEELEHLWDDINLPDDKNPAKLKERIKNYQTKYDTMYGSNDKDYETEYDSTISQNTKGDKVIDIGRLSRKWQDMGGAVRYDRHGNAVLDIEKQNELAKNDQNASDATTLLSYITKHGNVERKDADYLYDEGAKLLKDKPKFKKDADNDYKVINTSLLTPAERRELNKHKKYLMDAGIIGQDIAQYRLHKRQLDETSPRSIGEKAKRLGQYMGRGIVDVVDMAKHALASEYRENNPDWSINPEKIKQLETYNQANLVKGYDLWQSIDEPETTAEKVMELFGSVAFPIGGAGITSKAKSLLGTLIGSISATKAKEIADWAELTPEERAKEVKVNAPLRNILIDIASLSAGHSLTNIFKKAPNTQGLTGIERQNLKALINDKEAQKQAQEAGKQLQKEEIERAYKQLNEQLNTPTPFSFAEKGTINGISVNELQKNKPLIEQIMLQQQKSDLQDALGVTDKQLERVALPFEVKDTEILGNKNIIEKVRSKYSKALGKTYAGDRSELAVPENISHFDNAIKTEKELRGQNYVEKVSDIEQQPTYDKNKLNSLFREKGLDGVDTTLSDEQQKLVSEFQRKFENAKTMADVRNIMYDINDKYRYADNKERYILNKFREVNTQLIDEEIKTGGERGKWFEKFKQANEEYAKHSGKIEAMEDISETYKGNKSKYQAPENREVKLGVSMADNWDKLTNEQKSLVIKNAPNEVKNRLQKMELLNINPQKITEYDNLMLKNAFGNEADKIINFASQIASKKNNVSQLDALMQATIEYNKGNLSKEGLQSVFAMADGDIKKLNSIFENVIMQNAIFTKHKFAEYAKKGDISSTANSINNIDDLKIFDELIENWENKYNIPQLKEFSKQVKDYKWDSIINENNGIYNELKSYQDTPEKITADTFLKQTEKSIMHFNKNKRILEELAGGNPNLQANFEAIQEFTSFASTIISNAEDYVDTVLKNNQPLQKYRALVAKKEAKWSKINRPSKIDKIAINKAIDFSLYSSVFGKAHQFLTAISSPYTYISLPVYIGYKALKSVRKSLISRSLRKLKEDPEYIYKKIYEAKNAINRLEDYIYEVKSVSAKFFPQIVASKMHDTNKVNE